LPVDTAGAKFSDIQLKREFSNWGDEEAICVPRTGSDFSSPKVAFITIPVARWQFKLHT